MILGQIRVRARQTKNPPLPSKVTVSQFSFHIDWKTVILPPSERLLMLSFRTYKWPGPANPPQSTTKSEPKPLSLLSPLFSFPFFGAIFGHKPLREHQWGALGFISGVLDPYRGLRVRVMKKKKVFTETAISLEPLWVANLKWHNKEVWSPSQFVRVRVSKSKFQIYLLEMLSIPPTKFISLNKFLEMSDQTTYNDIMEELGSWWHKCWGDGKRPVSGWIVS